jgi:hypothetical protein
MANRQEGGEAKWKRWYYEYLNFYLRFILLTMVLRPFHDHHAAFEYRGNKKGNDFVTVENKNCIQIFKYVLRCLLSFVIIVALA